MKEPTVTREEALQAFRTLGKLLQETYEVPRDELLHEITPVVPARIFASELSPFSALATYLHQQEFSDKQIAKMLGRNKSFVTASIKETTFEEGEEKLPLSIFSGKLSILESAALELKRQGHDTNEIADILAKNPSTIWTVLRRAEKKRGEGDE